MAWIRPVRQLLTKRLRVRLRLAQASSLLIWHPSIHPDTPIGKVLLSLKGFADKTGGRLISTAGGQALRDSFAEVANELGHQYTISYRPVNKAHDGKWRTLEVKVNREDAFVRTRKGYRAPKK